MHIIIAETIVKRVGQQTVTTYVPVGFEVHPTELAGSVARRYFNRLSLDERLLALHVGVRPILVARGHGGDESDTDIPSNEPIGNVVRDGVRRFHVRMGP